MSSVASAAPGVAGAAEEAARELAALLFYRSLRDVLVQLRLFGGWWSGYRWDCLLEMILRLLFGHEIVYCCGWCRFSCRKKRRRRSFAWFGPFSLTPSRGGSWIRWGARFHSYQMNLDAQRLNWCRWIAFDFEAVALIQQFISYSLWGFQFFKVRHQSWHQLPVALHQPLFSFPTECFSCCYHCHRPGPHQMRYSVCKKRVQPRGNDPWLVACQLFASYRLVRNDHHCCCCPGLTRSGRGTWTSTWIVHGRWRCSEPSTFHPLGLVVALWTLSWPSQLGHLYRGTFEPVIALSQLAHWRTSYQTECATALTKSHLWSAHPECHRCWPPQSSTDHLSLQSWPWTSKCHLKNKTLVASAPLVAGWQGQYLGCLHLWY